METFKPGDWVDWAYEANDPNGPYAHLLDWNKFNNNADGGLNGDPINDRLIRYRKPPYRVVQVFFGKIKWHPEGGRWYVRVRMYQKKKWGGPKTKIREFPIELFKKVPSPRTKKK